MRPHQRACPFRHEPTPSRKEERPDLRVLIGIATYNERENLPPLVKAIRTALPGAHVLIVDDDSPDGTGKWASAEAQRCEGLFHLGRPGKQGLGSAIRDAIRWAIAHRYDYFINMDADHSHDPADLRRLVAAAEELPDPARAVVIGSRYVRGGQTPGWPWYRRVMSRCVNVYARWLLWLPVRDASSGYRLMAVPLLERIDWTRVRAQGYAFLEELLWHLKKAGAHFHEIPIAFTNRRHGTSKINTAEAVRALVRILCLGLARR